MSIPSDESYQAYHKWQKQEEVHFKKLENNLDSMPPNLALIAMIGFLMEYSRDQMAWSADGIHAVSLCLSGVNLNEFSPAASCGVSL